MTADADRATGSEPETDFEDALRDLEAIADDLERGESGLSEALAKYEQGVRLLARCQGVLDRAEQSVALLTGVDEAGNPLTAPLDPAATEAPGPAATPAAPARKSRKRPPPPRGEAGDDSDHLIPF